MAAGTAKGAGMKKQAIADLPAIQRRDREALEMAEREGITFSEAWARLLHAEERKERER